MEADVATFGVGGVGAGEVLLVECSLRGGELVKGHRRVRRCRARHRAGVWCGHGLQLQRLRRRAAVRVGLRTPCRVCGSRTRA